MIWMNLAVFNDIICRSKLVFTLGFIGSWVCQVPSVLIAIYIKKDIVYLYYGVSFGYFSLCML